MLNKTLFGLSLVAAFSTVSLSVQAAEYHVVVPAPGKAAPYASIKLELNPASLPLGIVGDAYAGFDFNTALRITGDSELDMSQVAWSVHSDSLAAGYSLSRGGSLYGTPTEVGEISFQVLARYKTKSASRTYQTHVLSKKFLIDNAGVRSWNDGTVASSCLDYRLPAYPYVYAGDTGDGIYRIAPEGSPIDVYCDMTSDGGGWTLLMKQAKGDGATLQGDTSYWKNGTTLNDSQSSMNMTDENFVSAAFSQLPTTQLMLQASNESTTQRHVNASSMTAQMAFSDNNVSQFADPPGTWYPSRPNWSIRTSTYPSGHALSTARFGFNFGEYRYDKYYCAVRWGWAGNENNEPSGYGSHDACGGLGGWGEGYGSAAMRNDKSAWQPATLYLWGK